MKRQTRELLLNLATGAAIAAAAAVMLMPVSASAQDNTPSFGFGINVPGPNGGNIHFGIGNNPPPRDAQVCFFERSRFRGDSFCVEGGAYIRDLDDWSGEISSIDNPDGLSVTVCTRRNLRGDCRTYTSGARSLGGLDDEIVSVRVR
jgi:hypothetical protein